ncbi:pfs domain protein [Rutstroemia sp. NJR-2017a BVV2]|nr:pfs domain protein [Rutstroemia sp. NJR-2017a BVV2]
MYVVAVMADISSGWSTWKWDSSCGAWYASRKKPDGSYEYEYQYNNTAGDQSQTPRTTDANIYAATQSTQGSSTRPYQNSYQNSYPNYPDSEHDATPRGSISSMSSSTNTYYNPTVASSSRDYNVAQNWAQTTTTGMTGATFNRYTNASTYSQPTVRSPEYTYTRSTAASSSVDSTANSFGQMSLAPPPALATQAQQSGFGYPVPKHIRKAPNTGNSESLDPRYQTVPERDQNNFFRVGRVFMMLWTEPARDPPADKVPYGGGSRNGSHYSTTYLGGSVYTEIRRFVIVAKQHGNSICWYVSLPLAYFRMQSKTNVSIIIHTYSGAATLKYNLPDVQEHTMIYTTEEPPAPHSYIAEDGSLVQEQLTKIPIRVVREQPDAEGNLDPKSRLNYSKIYTVEHYVRVLNIGMVHNNSMTSLVNSCHYQRVDPPQKASTNPPRAGGDKKHRKGSKH